VPNKPNNNETSGIFSIIEKIKSFAYSAYNTWNSVIQSKERKEVEKDFSKKIKEMDEYQDYDKSYNVEQ
jgi:hypothetical protein